MAFANVGQQLVNVANAAFVDGAQLILDLDESYTPSFGQSFTLVSADAIIGAGPDFGNAVFQYTDGDTFFISGVEFQIDWVTGSENIVLTVIPEPRAYGLLVLALAGLAVAARKSVNRQTA